jgi:hypothetical protein
MMLTYRVSKVPTSRRGQNLSARVRLQGVEADMPCSPCAAFRSLCYFSKAFTKCLECVRRDV